MAKRYLRWNGGTSGDLNVGANYEVDGVPEATIPIAGDELTFSGTPDLTPATNFAALTALLLDKVTIDQSYSLELGDDDSYLELQALKVEIGQHNAQVPPTGSPRLKLHFKQDASNACDVTVHNSASQSSDLVLPPIQLLSEHTGADTILTVLNVHKGKVGVAITDPSEVSELLSANVDFVNNRDVDARLQIGPLVTIANVTKAGGDCVLESAATTVENRAGTLETRGSGAITTLTNSGGTTTCNSSGTITTLNADGGVADFTKSTTARTVTNTNRRGVGRIRFDSNVMTFTNAIDTGGPVELTVA